MRGGYYPAAAEAIAHVATFLRPPVGAPFAIADPCAGEGAAIQQLAELLGCPQTSVYVIELDDDRAATLHGALPDAHVLAPANFLGCRASLNSFELMWLNPPFDDAYGGRRVELQFLNAATDWLRPGGVMALVCPEDVVSEYTDARRHFQTFYENCMIVPFPKQCRPFKEVIVLAHKRTRPRMDDNGYISWASIQAPAGFAYDIPPGPGPRTFLKVEPTENELRQMLAHSPLRAHLAAPAPVGLASPPLALGIGHVALLLASGHLDGVVHPEGQPPHVVRGTSRKREFVAEENETENDDGTVTRKTVISEKIELVVRTVDVAGNMQTFMETDAKEE
jgi:hypothetical protein